MIRILNRALVSGLALASAIVWCSWAAAQEPGTSKDKDDALDSLIEKLAEPDRPGKPASEAQKPGKEAKPEGSRTGSKLDAQAPGGGGKPSKPADTPKPGGGDVSSKDKELDDLLEKLGETKDEPAADDRRRGHPQPGEPSEPAPPASGGGGGDKDKEKTKDRPKSPGLQGKDKEIDERLEEFAGKKRKKNRSEQEEGSGAMGQLIKEMRDVEQRLGKPETGEDTQAKQKRIVKQIETLIEQMRQSGSSGSMAMRQVRQQGQKPGNQPGQTPGANAAGAPSTKPAKPSDRHALAGGKDIWGHLPAELRQEMENVFKEDALPTKQDLIRRYYLSVAKQKLVRGE